MVLVLSSRNSRSESGGGQNLAYILGPGKLRYESVIFRNNKQRVNIPMEVVELAEETPVNTQFTVADLDIEILPIIYEIIRRFAKVV